MSSSYGSRSLPFLGVLGLIVVLAVVFWVRQAGLIDFEAIGAFVEGYGAMGLLLYGVVYAFLSMFGISKVAMTVLAGAIFSFTEAMVVTVLASTLAGVAGFNITRYFKDRINKRLFKPKADKDKSAWREVFEKIEASSEDRGFYTISILRLSFVPLMMISYAAGLVRTLGQKEFFWAIFLTNIYINFVYIFVGASVTQSLPMFAAGIALLLLFMQTPRLVKKLNNV